MPCDPKLLQKLQSARELPTLPAVLIPLLRHLERPLRSHDVHQIVDLIAKDESLAARCLHIANSPYSVPAARWRVFSPPSLSWGLNAFIRLRLRVPSSSFCPRSKMSAPRFSGRTRSAPSFNRSLLPASPLEPKARWKKCVPWSRKCMEACSESR